MSRVESNRVAVRVRVLLQNVQPDLELGGPELQSRSANTNSHPQKVFMAVMCRNADDENNDDIDIDVDVALRQLDGWYGIYNDCLDRGTVMIKWNLI